MVEVVPERELSGGGHAVWVVGVEPFGEIIFPPDGGELHHNVRQVPHLEACAKPHPALSATLACRVKTIKYFETTNFASKP